MFIYGLYESYELLQLLPFWLRMQLKKPMAMLTKSQTDFKAVFSQPKCTLALFASRTPCDVVLVARFKA